MYREEINYLVKKEKIDVIEYLDAFSKTLISNYDIEPNNLCEKFDFILGYSDLNHINVKSYLKKDINDEKFHIEVNETLEEEDKKLEILKEIMTFFLIKYFINKKTIDEEKFFESQYYFHYSKQDYGLDIDYIIDYFSRIILYELENNKKEKKKNVKKINKIHKKIIRLVNKD